MSEPRYPTRVSDPDQTTRIPKEALDGLSSSGAPAKEANGRPPQAPANGTPTGAPSSPGVPATGSTPPPRNGSTPSSGSTPAQPGANGGSNGYRAGEGSRPSLFGASSPAPSSAPASSAPASSGPASSGPAFGGGSGGSGGSSSFDGSRASGSAGGFGGSGSGSGGPAGSGSGYTGRSETGYSPAAYPSTNYTPTNYSSLGTPDRPTTVGGGAGVATASRPASGARPKGRGGAAGRPARRARLLVRHIDPWSTLKFSFVLAVAMFFVWLVAIGVLYGVLDGMGVFEQINGLYSEVAGNGTESLFTPSLVLGTAALVGAVNIVLFTALATIGAFVYNICADLVGGIEVTLAERD